MIDKIYAEISKLFPSELGVGDVVKKGKKSGIVKEAENEETVIVAFNKHYSVEEWQEDLKLIRKNITLSMVLEAMYKNQENINHIYGVLLKLIDKWQLRKDGKDLSLYDQSIDLIKLVGEVLK